MKSKSSPLARLQHHVTGAIERGEAQAIEGIPASVPVDVTGTILPDSPVKDAPERCLQFTPMISELRGLTNRCCLCSKLESEHAPASPVDSVGVPEVYKVHPEHKRKVCFQNGAFVAECATQPEAVELVVLLNSHAVKDAKIKALEVALKRFVSLCPSSEGMGGFAPHGAFQIAAESAHAALALPCA